jgi:hypothetical protein
LPTPYGNGQIQIGTGVLGRLAGSPMQQRDNRPADRQRGFRQHTRGTEHDSSHLPSVDRRRRKMRCHRDPGRIIMMATTRLRLALLSVLMLTGCDHSSTCSVDKARLVGFTAAKDKFPDNVAVADNPGVTDLGVSWRIEYATPGYIGGAPIATIRKADCSVEKVESSQ